MPPAKKATKKAVKRTVKRSSTRKMSAAHKAALAEGRTMSATVDHYLSAVNAPKPRGRKVSKASLQQRLAAAQARAKSANGVDKVLAAQEVRDLRARVETTGSASTGDIKPLEVAFVKVAKKFGQRRGISYGAWRDVGVPADVLRRANVHRTRG